jgi:hypothetical protein
VGTPAAARIQNARRTHPDQRDGPNTDSKGQRHKQAANNGYLRNPPRQRDCACVCKPVTRGLDRSDQKVWIDRYKTTGFNGVSRAVWDFHVGGYPVCEKWLKDRRGRTLSMGDITQYQKIVVAITETIRLMKEIDRVIENHGGWPGAFQAAGSSDATAARAVAAVSPVRN